MSYNNNRANFSSLDKFRYHDKDSVTTPFKVSKISKSPLRKKLAVIIDAAKYKDLPPSLDPNVRLVFVGFNPGVESSLKQHHYAHFTNLFWKLFNQSQILIKLIDHPAIIPNDQLLNKLIVKIGDGEYKTLAKPEHDFELIKYGVGFTDLVLRCTKTAQELSKQEKLDNVPRLINEFKYAKPQFVVVIGKGIWETIVEYLRLDLNLKFKLDKNFKWGRQLTGGGTPLYDKILQRWNELIGYEFNQYVFPNTSGLVTSLKYDEKLELWNELANDVSD